MTESLLEQRVRRMMREGFATLPDPTPELARIERRVRRDPVVRSARVALALATVLAALVAVPGALLNQGAPVGVDDGAVVRLDDRAGDAAPAYLDLTSVVATTAADGGVRVRWEAATALLDADDGASFGAAFWVSQRTATVVRARLDGSRWFADLRSCATDGSSIGACEGPARVLVPPAVSGASVEVDVGLGVVDVHAEWFAFSGSADDPLVDRAPDVIARPSRRPRPLPGVATGPLTPSAFRVPQAGAEDRIRSLAASGAASEVLSWDRCYGVLMPITVPVERVREHVPPRYEPVIVSDVTGTSAATVDVSVGRCESVAIEARPVHFAALMVLVDDPERSGGAVAGSVEYVIAFVVDDAATASWMRGPDRLPGLVEAGTIHHTYARADEWNAYRFEFRVRDATPGPFSLIATAPTPAASQGPYLMDLWMDGPSGTVNFAMLDDDLMLTGATGELYADRGSLMADLLGSEELQVTGVSYSWDRATQTRRGCAWSRSSSTPSGWMAAC